jgi:transcriptional regulator with XRE-family HTH domain
MRRAQTLDLDRIDKLMAYLRIEQADLARMTGIAHGALSRILRGERNPGPNNVNRIARALRVPAFLLTTFAPEGWQWASQEDPVTDDLFWVLGEAETLLSLAPKMGSFLLPHGLHMRIETPAMENAYGDLPDFPERVERYRRLRHERLLARQQKKYVMKLYTGYETPRLAAQTNPAWLDDIAEMAREYRDKTAVALIPDDAWPRIDRLIRSHLLDVPWYKINVADTTLACVYTFHYVHYSFDPKIVGDVKKLIENQIAEEIPGPFPTMGQEKRPNGAAYMNSAYKHFTQQLPSVPSSKGP